MREWDEKNNLKGSLTSDIDYFEIICENIKQLRGRMTQRKLAKKADISRSTINAIEQGIPISLRKLFKVAEALNVSSVRLFMTDEERLIFKHAIEGFANISARFENIEKEINELKNKLKREE